MFKLNSCSLWFSLLVSVTAGAVVPVERPALVLVISIDQMGRERLDPGLPGGIGLIARQGRIYANALLDHAITETCPGHATILSGRNPATTGIIANSWLDPVSGESIYCVEDTDPGSAVLMGTGGRSPALMKTDTLGDWMKAGSPGTRVFSVSAKDRAAVILGGKDPDAAYWLSTLEPGGFTTSSYYLSEIPVWVKEFNGKSPFIDGFAREFPDQWIHTADKLRADDYKYESDKYGRSSGHPLRSKDLPKALEQLWNTPFLDDATLAFARQLIVEEQPGKGETTDLLAVSLSATDTIGHLYGPNSSEAKAAMLQLDASLGDFFTFLDSFYGSGRVLVVLTADHGVLAIPEWLTETGQSSCPLPGGRQNAVTFVAGLIWHTYWKFGPLFALPGSLVNSTGNQLSVNRSLAKAHGVDPEEVIQDLKGWLEKQQVVRQAWTRDEILQGSSPTAILYRHSYDPDRSSDLVLQFESTCLIKPGGGTTHGTPYEYDRGIPLVFYGPWIEPGRVDSLARTIDIAPSLARMLGVQVPADLDGAVLP
jgi:predicted AlkP superfamily pyrophosphatase or phosphodiesterase